ncbi:MAG: hypothetical protein OXB93_04430, partial [Cytophagales bacterium]|nr:hypothetical protein [Cytophagales bacterium]
TEITITGTGFHTTASSNYIHLGSAGYTSTYVYKTFIIDRRDEDTSPSLRGRTQVPTQKAYFIL